MFTVTHQIPKKRVYEVVVSGIESGGYGSFYVPGDDWRKGWEAADRGEHAAFSACLFTVKYEEDREDYKPQPLTDTLLQAGLNIMAENYPKHLTAIIEENDDAITGDVLLQCSLLGDVVYG
jgi:hypothetical protein